MDTADLSRAIQQALAPLQAELVRIRSLLEQLAMGRAGPTHDSTPLTPNSDGGASRGANGSQSQETSEPPSDAAILAPPQAPPESTPNPTAAARIVATPAVAASDSRATPVSEGEAAEADLLRQLLAEYPEDAAAVYFAFDRQQRCAPQRLDRLARRNGLEPAWYAANRATIRALTERHHGGLHMVAELIGRDSDSLHALLGRIGLSQWVESVRARERDRLRQAPFAVRLGELLFREKMLHDLGIRQEMDTRMRQELRARCAALSGECETAEQVFERLAQECNLDDNGIARMVRRFDLPQFVADLYQEPTESERPASRRVRQEARPRLDDEEIEARILQMLLAKRKVGAAHTHIDHLVRTVPPHERGRARAIIDRLLREGSLSRKVTDNSSEPHVSIAVAAVPAIEQRLRTRPETTPRPETTRRPETVEP